MEAPLLPTHSPREGAGPNVAGRWMTIKAIDGKRPIKEARKPDTPLYVNTWCDMSLTVQQAMSNMMSHISLPSRSLVWKIDTRVNPDIITIRMFNSKHKQT